MTAQKAKEIAISSQIESVIEQIRIKAERGETHLYAYILPEAENKLLGLGYSISSGSPNKISWRN